MTKTNIIIIGAGLTGLTLKYLLKKNGIDAVILEARDRIGGRILTVQKDDAYQIEMGATWLGQQHLQLRKLLEELDISIFPQLFGQKAIYEPLSTSPHQLVTLPLNENPTFRTIGGTSHLLQTLVDKANGKNIHLNKVVTSITQNDDAMIVETESEQFRAQKVVSTLPPFLLHKSIKIQPLLPENISRLLSQTHTWMGDSIKVGIVYDNPFWLASSGTIVSNVGPIPEMYDHSNYENKVFALKGFFNGSYHSLSKDERLKMVLGQLRKYYGDIVESYTSYHETVWRNEAFTSAPYDSHVLPHENNGHPLLRESYLNDRFYIAGAETAQHNPGYMEGAVRSAYFVFDQIVKSSQI